MREAPPFLQALDLAPDADARAARRAYAQRLKQIDQEADPAAFQALRENYEAALLWIAHQEAEAAATAEPVVDSEGTAPVATSADAAAPEQPSRPDPYARSHAIARELLDELAQSMAAQPLVDHEDGQRRLNKALEDPRLLDMDARFLFEGGLAAQLANGWRPGHEHLFGPALQLFEWRTDRTRLRAFGRAGELLDQAIAELEVYDEQPSADRQPQRDMIRRLRDSRRPEAEELARAMPQIRRLVALYPNWLYVISSAPNVNQWYEWSHHLPASMLKEGAKPAQEKKSASGGSPFVWVFFVLMGLSALFKMAGSSAPTPPAIPTASYPPLRAPGTYPSYPAPYASPRTANPTAVSPDLIPKKAEAPAAPKPPPAVANLAQAQKVAAVLGKGKADVAKCRDADEILSFHAEAHAKGSLPRSFDKLLIGCLMGKLWRMPPQALDVAIAREQKRSMADVQRDLQLIGAPARPVMADKPVSGVPAGPGASEPSVVRRAHEAPPSWRLDSPAPPNLYDVRPSFELGGPNSRIAPSRAAE